MKSITISIGWAKKVFQEIEEKKLSETADHSEIYDGIFTKNHLLIKALKKMRTRWKSTSIKHTT